MKVASRSKLLMLGLCLFSAIYILWFDIAFRMALLSPMVAENSNIPSFIVGVVIVIMFLLPLSIPISIFLMWLCYFLRKTKQAIVYAGLPFYILLVIILFSSILDAIFL